jgi:hypothetical protein
MNTELARMWKGTVLAFFKVVSRHLMGVTGENKGNLALDSWCLIEIGATYLVDANS